MWRLLAANRLRMARNRAGGQSALGRAAVLALGAGAAAGLLLAGRSLGADVAAAQDPPAAARELAFWLATAAAMIASYTVLEALFRSDEARVLAPLPVEPGAWARYTVARVALLHAGLLVPPLLVLAPLLAWSPAAALAGAAVVVCTLLVAVPVALLSHLLAGSAMLTGDSELKRRLSGGLGPPEGAWFFYSPAIALALALVATVVFDLLARLAADVGNPKPLLAALTAAAAVAAVATRKALHTFEARYAAILPRFWESEILPPWHEEHLPRHARGMGAARLLHGAARHAYERDLLQLRRRHRVDGVALAVWAVACALLQARSDGAAPVGWAVALVAAGGVLFDPTFRLVGGELDPPAAGRALPLTDGELLRARLLLVAVFQGPAVLLAALAAALGPAGPLGALVGLAGGAAISLGLGALSLRLTLVSAHVRPVAWSVRLGAVGAFAAAVALLPPL